MKLRWWIVIALTVFILGSLGDGTWAGEHPTLEVSIREHDASGGVTRWGLNEAIVEWAKNGVICEVLGHSYGLPITRRKMTGMNGMEVLFTEETTHECSVCKKVQTLFEEWR